MITRLCLLGWGCRLDSRAAKFISAHLQQKVAASCRALSMSAKPRVFITRKVPDVGPALLKSQCDVIQWDKDDAIPRDELLRGVKGADALFCLLTEKIDAELLGSAGEE